MTDLQRLENAITELLMQHECVIIPNLGAFLLRSFPASANAFSGEIKPSGQTLFFNPSVTTDDGLLLNKWKQTLGIDYATAQKSIQELVETINSCVKSKRSQPLGKLGNFFLHSDGKLLFLPSASVNLSKTAFGLSPLKVNELTGLTNARTNVAVIETKVVSKDNTSAQNTEEIEEAEVVELKISQQRSKSIFWKIAAAFCLISLSAAAVYFGKLFNSQRQHMQMASQLPSSPTKIAVEEKTNPVSESNKKASAFVSLLTEEDMNMGMEQITNGKGTVFICGGSYLTIKLAEIECNSWKKAGIPAVIGRKKGSSLVKVVIGRFENEQDASAFLEFMPINSGFHAGLLTAKLQF